MKKEELSQYRSLKKEIEYIDSKINSYRTQTTVKSSSLEFPYTQRAVTIQGLEQSSTRDVLRLINRKQQCISLCDNIEQFIDGIDDSCTRRVFEYRYIEGCRRMGWQQIAILINEHDESYPRRKHNKYLKRAENVEKCVI